MILVVDDEENITSALKEGLENEGHCVHTSLNGEDAFFLMNTNKYDLVILDWMLPGRSGVEILKAFRSKGSEIPVLLLTAKDGIDDKINGLDAGADDYLVKPFDFLELSARIRSLLRRDKYRKDQGEINIKDLMVKSNDRSVTRIQNNEIIPIYLTKTEFDLLYFLCKNYGNIVSRDMISKEVWKMEQRATSMDGIIDVHINRLRKKIDEPFSTKIIITIRGVGFRIDL